MSEQRDTFINEIPTDLPGGFFIYEPDGDLTIVYADPNIVSLYGCETQEEFREFCGNSFKGMVHPDDFQTVQNDVSAQVFTLMNRHDYVRYRLVRKDGSVRYVEDFGHIVYGRDGKSYFYVYLVDIEEREYNNLARNSLAESEVLVSMNDFDRLTGLLGPVAFIKEAQEALDVMRGFVPITFVHFNIVNFKVFNEEFGFSEGDDLLCSIARVLSEEFEGQIISRLSNDHFVVCAEMDEETVVKHTVSAHDRLLGFHQSTKVELKAGIYVLEDSCTSALAASDHARLAESNIKRHSDKVYLVFNQGLYDKLRLKQYVIDNIDTAVENEYLKVYYQPVIRVETKRICGYEALARWEDPTMGLLSPADFINTLEEYRLINKVDQFVIRKVMQDLATLRETGEPLEPVSVNLSRLDFELCDIFAYMESCRAEFDIAPELVDIEITESVLNATSLYLLESINKFREAGYHIWIDDFGSGYSALNSLLDYDFEVLKLDLEFLRTYDEHPKAGQLISDVINMAKDMGAEPLQEGVESEEHFEFLRHVGCAKAQGYYFSKPLPLDESRKLTQARGLKWE